jgi:hypothetical protein
VAPGLLAALQLFVAFGGRGALRKGVVGCGCGPFNHQNVEQRTGRAIACQRNAGYGATTSNSAVAAGRLSTLWRFPRACGGSRGRPSGAASRRAEADAQAGVEPRSGAKARGHGVEDNPTRVVQGLALISFGDRSHEIPEVAPVRQGERLDGRLGTRRSLLSKWGGSSVMLDTRGVPAVA